MALGLSAGDPNPTASWHRTSMIRALEQHWPEYGIEAWALGTFMASAALFTALASTPKTARSSGSVRKFQKPSAGKPLARRAASNRALALAIGLSAQMIKVAFGKRQAVPGGVGNGARPTDGGKLVFDRPQ